MLVILRIFVDLKFHTGHRFFPEKLVVLVILQDARYFAGFWPFEMAI